MSFDDLERRALEQKIREDNSARVVNVNNSQVDRRLFIVENKLREIIADEVLDAKIRGQLGNLLGEIKEARRTDVNSLWSMTQEAHEFLKEFREDPVIRAYVEQKAQWKDKVHNLRTQMRNAFSALGEDYDD